MWTRAPLATLLFAFASALSAQTPARTPSMLVPGTTVKLSAHVYAIPDVDTTQGVPNVGIIVGTKAVLVVDTGMGEANGRIALAEAQKVAPGRQFYIVTTHVHPEHDLGASAFPTSAKMIRSLDQEKDIAEFGLQVAQLFASRSANDAALLKGAGFRKADIEFATQYDLDLGEVHVHIQALGPNHTRGDTAIFVEPDRVLFAGDVAMAPVPAFASPYSSLDHWLASLDVLASFKPAIVVPSHGPIGDASYIANYRTFMTTVRDRTRALKKEGRTVDETIQIINTELIARYPNAPRLAGAVRVAYQEAP